MNLHPMRPIPEVNLRGIPAFRTEHFPASHILPWLDQPDWQNRIAALRRDGEISEEQAVLCRFWAEHGYVVIEHMFDADELDSAWESYELAIASGRVVPQQDYGQSPGDRFGRVLNPHLQLPGIDALLKNVRAKEIVSLLLGATALPFQTIAGHVGSQQKAHSDSIHMTTYPQGFLVANWIAFEDITPDSGPLEYYPGSHRLPYLYSRECQIGLEEGRSGYAAYHAKYEPAVQDAIRSHGLEAKFFHARKGDVLFWHANLLHGGSPIRNPQSSRRALVCHYFAEGCVCYHDYTGTPSYLTRLPMLTCEQFDSASYLALNPDVAAAGVDAYQHYVDYGYAEGRRTQ